MGAEPPDQMPTAGSRGDLRASHADREQVIGTLKAAFVQERLAKDEFDLRVGQALASRTYAELAAVTADLPAGLTAAQPSKAARAPGERRVLRPGLVMTVATVLYAGTWPLALVLPRTSDEGDPIDGMNLVFGAFLVYVLVMTLACVWAQALRSPPETRSGERLPGRQAPGAGGQASRRLPSAGPDRQLPPVDPGHRHTAEAARRRLPRPPSPVRGYRAGGTLAAGAAPARG